MESSNTRSGLVCAEGDDDRKMRETTRGRAKSKTKEKSRDQSRKGETGMETRPSIGVSYSPIGKLRFSLHLFLFSFCFSRSGVARLTALWTPFALLITSKHARRFVYAAFVSQRNGLPIIIIPPIIIGQASFRARSAWLRSTPVYTYVATCVKMYEPIRRFMDRRWMASWV